MHVCQLLLRHGARVATETCGEDGDNISKPTEPTPLYIAIVEGHYSIVELFLNNLIGPPPAGGSRNTTSDSSDSCGLINEPCDNLGRSPLSVASSEGQVGVIELLLSRNADIESRNGENELSPLIWAVIGKYYS